MSDFVRFDRVKKTYRMGEVVIEALRDASFSVERGELCVIVGPSGAGKTTLLNILGGMDTLTEGRVLLEGEEISAEVFEAHAEEIFDEAENRLHAQKAVMCLLMGE